MPGRTQLLPAYPYPNSQIPNTNILTSPYGLLTNAGKLVHEGKSPGVCMRLEEAPESVMGYVFRRRKGSLYLRRMVGVIVYYGNAFFRSSLHVKTPLGSRVLLQSFDYNLRAYSHLVAAGKGSSGVEDVMFPRHRKLGSPQPFSLIGHVKGRHPRIGKGYV